MNTIKRNKGRFALGNIGFWKGKKRPNMMGKNNPKYNSVELRCEFCHKKFLVPRCRMNKARFCSHSCRAKSYFTKEKNPNWKGGNSSESSKFRTSDNYKKWRMKVFQRDWFTCRQCGHRSCKSKAHGDKRSDIEAHHIIPVRDNPSLALKVGNGITLCERCHKRTYGKEEKFVKVFKEILNDYTSNIEKS